MADGQNGLGGTAEDGKEPEAADPAMPGDPELSGEAAGLAGITTAREFGQELTAARQRAGLTVREVARQAGIPPSTAGDYFAGRHLPPVTQPGLLPTILRACSETDPARLAEWAHALSRIRRAAWPPAAATPPYRGLAGFQLEDAEWFFGREGLTARLATLAVLAEPDGSPGLPLAVVGPSGSGKSSLLRAGLIPALRSAARPPLALFTPGARPLRELARQLARLQVAGSEPDQAEPDDVRATQAEATQAEATQAEATQAEATQAEATQAEATQIEATQIEATQIEAAQIEAALRSEPAEAARLIAAGTRPVIVADQFEEVFAACPDEAERQAFITAITALPGAALVVLALRADFYAAALRYPELAQVLQDRQIVVGPMTRDEVRRAITEPARLARLEVEQGLVELLLRDVAPRQPDPAAPGAGHEAGALPLLSHALLTTWEHSRGCLTVAAYQASGGIQDAIAQTAERAYGQLGPGQQQIARRLFLRLVHVADDVPETRSLVQLSELQGWPDGTSAEEVLARFVSDRLITVDSGTAQISHEALVTAWPRLGSWIDTDRDGLRLRHRISDAARAWDEIGQDPTALLRGGQLTVARDWAAVPENSASLNPLAREFVTAGTRAEELQQATERGRTRRLRRLVAALTVLVLATVGLAGYGFAQQRAASAAGRRATSAERDAQSREAAIEANQARGQNTALAAQLSLAAYQIAPTAEARSSLLESSGDPAAARLADSAGVVQAVSLSPDRRVLAVAGADGTLRLWDVARPGHPVPLGGPLLGPGSNPLYAVTFSPDGRLLAAAGAARIITLWNVADPGHPVRLGAPLTGPANTVYSLAFSPAAGVPAANILAAGSADDTVRLWQVTAGGPASVQIRALARLTGPAGYVESVAFSPDGRLLAAGSADRTVRLWNVAHPAKPAALGRPLTGPGALVDSVAFSPDGRMLAAASQDDKVWLWSVTRPGHPVPAGTLTGATDWVNVVAFSPDGRSLAAGSSDGQARVWSLPSRTLSATLPHPQPVTSLAWDTAGRLVTGDADGTVRLWTLPAPVLLAGGPVNSVAYRPGGAALAVGGSDLQLWTTARPAIMATAAAPGPAGTIVNAVAWSPAGSLLAAGYSDGMVQLWQATATSALVPVSRPIQASGRGMVEFTAFSPDGRLLATSGDDGTVRLWSLSSPARPQLLATVNDSGSYVFSVAFSPDGHTLAAASADNMTRLWDITRPAQPHPLARPLTGPASYAISVAFSPDGHTLAVGSADKSVRLWNVTDPARPVSLGRPLTGPAGYVYSVAFSPDGRTLAAGATDGTAWLWQVSHPARPSLLAELTGPAHQVYSVAFSPSGRTLAAGSADGTVRLWDTAPRAAAAGVCAMAGQPLTRGEWATYLPGSTYHPPCSR